MTERFVESAYGDRRGCIQAQAAGGAASSVDVSAVEARGNAASARAIPHGGPNDGEKLTVKLVLEAGAWKVDSLRSNVPVGP